MKRLKDWLLAKFVDWLFYPPKRKRFDKISGWDDHDCFYAGEYENIWVKKKKSRWHFWKAKPAAPQKIV